MKALKQLKFVLLFLLISELSTAQILNPFDPVPSQESVSSFYDVVNNIDWGDHDIELEAPGVPCRSELYTFMETELEKIDFRFDSYYRAVFQLRLFMAMVYTSLENDFTEIETDIWDPSTNPRRDKMMDALRESISYEDFKSRFNRPNGQTGSEPPLSPNDIQWLETLYPFYTRLITNDQFLFTHYIHYQPGEPCAYIIDFYIRPTLIDFDKVDWQLRANVMMNCQCERPDNTTRNVDDAKVHLKSKLTSTMSDFDVENIKFETASRPRLSVDWLNCCGQQ
ncbi:MAG: hypothetical protein HKN48_09970 [Flavobacteriaceae bacterium]|nr:hypothetical protein [Flavobacteriaceae bacterium]